MKLVRAGSKDHVRVPDVDVATKIDLDFITMVAKTIFFDGDAAICRGGAVVERE